MDDAAKTSSGKVKKKHTNLRQHPYSNNLLHRIFDRENNNYDRYKSYTNASFGPTLLLPEMEMIKCIPPNFTIQNVDKPLGFMRKFTPDGQVLLSFSHDQRSLDVYEYRSIGAMADLLEGMRTECITAEDHSQQALHIRQRAFERMFVLRTSIRMKYGLPGGYLNREFSLFLSPEESRFVLIASMGIANHMPDVRDPYNYPDLYGDCDHFFYNFYLIDLLVDYISDYVTYKCDAIQLAHNHGVSAIGKRVAIHSRYRQCIDIYEVDDGSLKKFYTIGVWGAHLRKPCELLMATDDFLPQIPRPLSHFKQRIITFLFKRALCEDDAEIQKQKLKEFYKNFTKYERMVLSKMQLISKGLLLLRYEQHPQDQMEEVDFESYPLKLYVFYRIKTERVVNIFEGSSTDLMHILRDYIDDFRNVISYQTRRRPPSSCNSPYLQKSFNDTVSLLHNPPERLNPTLPVSSQSFSPSPFFDYSRYMYDDHQISALERPRVSSMDPVVFRDPVDQRVLFRLLLEQNDSHYYYDPLDEYSSRTRREMVAFILHPYEPFIISVQKLSQRYVVNFHIYNKSTVVSRPE